MEDLEIKKSRNGSGIFAAKGFAKGEDVFAVKGVFVTCDEDEEMDEATRANTFRFDEETYVSPAGELGDFLNHSCNPNAAVVKRGDALYVVAIKHIAKGEEVVIDYSTIIAADDSWEMACACGSSDCRKNIGKFKDLPPLLQKKYLSLNMVPAYILDKL